MLWPGVFAALSLLLLAMAWRTVVAAHPSGWLWFLAFEAVLGLIVLAAPAWFTDPFSVRQIASWLFLGVSAMLAVSAVVQLHWFGAPESGLETTRQLVERGAYRWIRHPLYFSLLLLGMGAWLKRPTAWGAAILVLLGVLVVQVSRIEEGENQHRFGDAYRAYMARSWRFLPRVY